MTITEPPPLPVKPAGFGIRLLAHLIDSAIWTFLLMLVVVGLFGGEIVVAARKAVEQASGGAVIIDPHMFQPPLWFTLVFNYALPVAVLVLLWKWKSATPGKMILGLKVVSADTGGPLTMKQCLLRMLGYVPPLIPLTLLMSAGIAPRPLIVVGAGVITVPLLWGFLSIATDPMKRGWHDKMAGTMVTVR
ncbi:MAG: RDD family protein [Verrucomicrobiaceae bacterium]|nr:RDD family protein [Verrucomicrobiaceae bacterium]